MANIYFPGCKYTAHSPDGSKRIQHYLRSRCGCDIAGCCSVDYRSLTEQDTAVYVCPTCSAILEENTLAKRVSIWELLLEDEQFPWPDHHGEKVTIQDCWRTYDNRKMQDAVRKVLKRMNFDVVEIDHAYDKADFCGISLLKPQSPRYEYLVPSRFIAKAGDKFVPHTEEEQIQKMKEHCLQFKTKTVVCYCTGCLEGLRIGGAAAVHLMDLVMASID